MVNSMKREFTAFIFYFFNFNLILIFLKILFYLTLQYCIGFAIYQNESATSRLLIISLSLKPYTLSMHGKPFTNWIK